MSDWPDASIAKLRKLWLQDDPPLSAAEIGRQMNISKNAVVGKAHRLGLPSRPSPIKRGGAPKPEKPQRLSAPPSHLNSKQAIPVERARELAVAPPPEVVRLYKPATVKPCCWPLGDPKQPGFHYCNAPAEPERPYCADHVAIAYVRVRDRREDAA